AAARTVSADLYIAPTGDDANGCTSVAPCKSFAGAYAQAQNGTVVHVTAGTYPAQYFAGGYLASQPAGTKDVTFLGEPGHVVRSVHSGSDNLHYDGINIDAGGAAPGNDAFDSAGSNDSFVNGSIGNIADAKGAQVSGSGFLFDNVKFHDAVLD